MKPPTKEKCLDYAMLCAGRASNMQLEKGADKNAAFIEDFRTMALYWRKLSDQSAVEPQRALF